MKVIYVAGYGRSGSTLLATLLGSAEGHVALGEVGTLLDVQGWGRRTCSCGLRYHRCPFWGGFPELEGDFTATLAALRAVESLLGFPRLLLGRVRPAVRERYVAHQRALFSWVEEQAGAGVAVDSSKSARRLTGRAVALHRLAGREVYVVHLVRDGRAVLESVLRAGTNRAREVDGAPGGHPGALRVVLGWITANLAAAAAGRVVGPERYLRVRYEDLVTDPEGTLAAIGDRFDVDLQPVMRRIRADDAFDVGHQVSGNRLRFQDEVRVRRGAPTAAGASLSPGQRALFTLLGGALNRRYGYAGRDA